MENYKLQFNACIKNAIQEQLDFKTLLESQSISSPCINQNSNNQKPIKILIELFQTEVSYLMQLELLIKFFLLPLSTTHSCLLPKKYWDIIFNNTLQVYNVNQELYLAIKADPNSIAIAFATFAPFLKLYSIYAYGYKCALATLEEQIKKNNKLYDFIKGQETRPEVGATLISLLIAPVQRVPRYRLLLQSLMGHYTPEHPHFLQTKDALSKVEETADHINRLIIDAEEGEALVQLARRFGEDGNHIVLPGRKILKQGLVRKTSKDGGRCQTRFLALLTDAILLAKGEAKGSLSSAKLYPLPDVQVEPVLGSSLFRLRCKEKDVMLQTTTPEEGTLWISDIQEAIKKCLSNRRTLRRDISHGDNSRSNILKIGQRRNLFKAKPSCLKQFRKLRKHLRNVRKTCSTSKN